MLLTVVYIVYHYDFIGGAVAFNLIDQLSEFTARQHRYDNLYQ